jgi:phospholipase/carboxylesterase
MSQMNIRLIERGAAFDALGLLHHVRDVEGAGPYAAIVLIHGRSGDENSMWAFAPALPKDGLLIAPRAIRPDPDGGYTWTPRRSGEWPSLEQFDDAVEAIARLIRALPGTYNVDSGRVYLMGFSQGAATAYAVAIKHRELVQGIAGLVGFMPEGETSSRASLQGLPIFMAVGKNDPMIPYERSRMCKRALIDAGARLDYHEYDTAHRLNAQGVRDLKEWWASRATTDR